MHCQVPCNSRIIGLKVSLLSLHSSLIITLDVGTKMHTRSVTGSQQLKVATDKMYFFIQCNVRQCVHKLIGLQ